MKIKSLEESTKKAIKIKSPEESTEIKSPKKDENTANWYDKNKFKKITAVVISNKFNHKTKIKKFKYTDIRDLVDNINKNTIGETDAIIKLNALNELKNAEINNKCLSSNQKELLELFADLLERISNNSNNNNNNSNNNSNNESENESESSNENDNENENEIEDDDDYEIKKINDYFKMIDESISFEDQINLLKIIDDINRYWHMSYYYDDEDLNIKIFEVKCAFLSNDLDEMLFAEIFGHAFATLIDKLINKTNKEENLIIVEDIKKNMDKLYEHDGFHNYIIQSSSKCCDLIDSAKIIVKFNETIQLAGDS